MEVRIDLMFLILAFMSAIAFKNAALAEIRKTGTKSYISVEGLKKPAGWMRRLYKIRSSYIPWFSWYELILAPAFMLIGLLNVFLYRIFSGVPNIVGILLMIQIGLALLAVFVFTIGYAVFTRRSAGRGKD